MSSRHEVFVSEDQSTQDGETESMGQRRRERNRDKGLIRAHEAAAAREAAAAAMPPPLPDKLSGMMTEPTKTMADGTAKIGSREQGT